MNGKRRTIYGSVRMGRTGSGKPYVKSISKKTKTNHTTTSSSQSISRKSGRAYPSGYDREGKQRPDKIIYSHSEYVGRNPRRRWKKANASKEWAFVNIKNIKNAEKSTVVLHGVMENETNHGRLVSAPMYPSTSIPQTVPE
jgi:hypothetical protein